MANRDPAGGLTAILPMFIIQLGFEFTTFGIAKSRGARLWVWFLFFFFFFTLLGGEIGYTADDLATLPPQQFPNIAGTWYREGDASKPTEIRGSGANLRFTNEFHPAMVSKGHFTSPSSVVADDWEGGLVGTLSGDHKRINWANGTSWQRLNKSQPDNVGGAAYQRGSIPKSERRADSTAPTLAQNDVLGESLTFGTWCIRGVGTAPIDQLCDPISITVSGNNVKMVRFISRQQGSWRYAGVLTGTKLSGTVTTDNGVGGGTFTADFDSTGHAANLVTVFPQFNQTERNRLQRQN